MIYLIGYVILRCIGLSISQALLDVVFCILVVYEGERVKLIKVQVLRSSSYCEVRRDVLELPADERVYVRFMTS